MYARRCRILKHDDRFVSKAFAARREDGRVVFAILMLPRKHRHRVLVEQPESYFESNDFPDNTNISASVYDVIHRGSV